MADQSILESNIIKPTTTDGSLTLQGDSSGVGVTGITIDSSGNATLNGTANDLGTVTAGTIGTGVTINAGSNVSGIGQLVGVSYSQPTGNGNYVTVENNKTYHVFISYVSTSNIAGFCEYWECSVNGSGIVTATEHININSNVSITHTTNAIRVSTALSDHTSLIAFVYEQGTTFDNG